MKLILKLSVQIGKITGKKKEDIKNHIKKMENFAGN